MTPARTSGNSALAVVATALGGALGYLCARVVLVNSALALVPWAIAGLLLGSRAGSRRGAALGGAAYGFVLAYVFMLASYDGHAALATRLIPFLAFGAVGAGCGAALALLGWAVSRRSSRAGTAGPAPRERDAGVEPDAASGP